MALVRGSTVTLRLFGEELDPAEITQLLGHPPTHSEKTGDQTIGAATGEQRTARTGSWLLSSELREPADLDAQILEILDMLSDDVTVWEHLSERFDADFFCGLFMSTGNEGVQLSRETLHEVAMRRLKIEFDIYDGNDRP